jgi:hypothetical protein
LLPTKHIGMAARKLAHRLIGTPPTLEQGGGIWRRRHCLLLARMA